MPKKVSPTIMHISVPLFFSLAYFFSELIEAKQVRSFDAMMMCDDSEHVRSVDGSLRSA